MLGTISILHLFQIALEQAITSTNLKALVQAGSINNRWIDHVILS